MNISIQSSLRFPAGAGFFVQAEFDVCALFTDFGTLLLRGSDQHIRLISRLTGSIADKRQSSYIDHSIADLHRQPAYLPLRLCPH